MAKQKKRSINAVITATSNKQVLEVPLYRKQLRALLQYVREASGKTVSALAFRQTFVSHVEPRIWLACVMFASMGKEAISAVIKKSLISC